MNFLPSLIYVFHYNTTTLALLPKTYTTSSKWKRVQCVKNLFTLCFKILSKCVGSVYMREEQRSMCIVDAKKKSYSNEISLRTGIVLASSRPQSHGLTAFKYFIDRSRVHNVNSSSTSRNGSRLGRTQNILFSRFSIIWKAPLSF